MNTKQKRYSLPGNVAWMVKICWQVRRRALFLCLTMALCDIFNNLAGLYIGPRVLGLVEAHSSLSQLLGTILFFTLALLLTQYGKTYLGGYNQFCLVENRTSIMMDISRKFNTTGYPNTLRAEFLRLRGKADDATDNNQSSTEELYRTITSLLTNLGGLIAYLTILSGLNGWLLLIIAVSCTGEFWAARYKDNWIYAHRDTENQFYLKKRYLRDKSESIELAKDIRIFGLQNWMNDLLTSIHDAYYDFQLKVEKSGCWWIWWEPFAL